MMSKVVGSCNMVLDVTPTRGRNMNIGATAIATKGKDIESRRGGDTVEKEGQVKVRKAVMMVVRANRTGQRSNARYRWRRWDA